MKRTGSKPLRWLGRRLAAIATLTLVGCASGPVTIDAGDAAPLSRSATIHVALAPRPESEQPTADGAIEAALDPELASALRAQTERALEARGYAIGSATDSDLVVELAPREQRTARRTWSSDPDASAARLVQRSEAVLGIRALSRSEGVEIWRCEARAKLPESARSPGARATELWSRVLSRALEPVPERR